MHILWAGLFTIFLSPGCVWYYVNSKIVFMKPVMIIDPIVKDRYILLSCHSMVTHKSGKVLFTIYYNVINWQLTQGYFLGHSKAYICTTLYSKQTCYLLYVCACACVHSLSSHCVV